MSTERSAVADPEAALPPQAGRGVRFLAVLDADSTLIENEVIELLAEEVGSLPEVAASSTSPTAFGRGWRRSPACRWTASR
jgi:phosphoserine phosphatase